MIEKYTAKQYDLPELVGMSKKSIEEHIKLYEGYVKNANLIKEKLEIIPADDTYTRTELMRRFSFEFCGMRNHELYFWSLMGSASTIPNGSKLESDIVRDFGSVDIFFKQLKEIAMTRSVGWAMLSYDVTFDHLTLSWVDEQHIGQLMNVFPVYAIDMWEHSYVYDYQPSGKKNYLEDYINNTNFESLANRYEVFCSSLKPL